MFIYFLLMLPLTESSAEITIRQKRQYYICGTYPNQFLSLQPCQIWMQTTRRSYDPTACSNGGTKIGVSCYFDYQCTPYSLWQPTVCLSNCCCTIPDVPPATIQPPSPVTTPSVANLAYCYNGQRSQVRCTTSTDCSAAQTCVNNICCTTTGNEYSGACGGLAALSACTNQQCGSFSCTSSNYCCECPFGRTSGQCAVGTRACPTGYTCSSSGYCCAQCASGRPPYGSCFNGLCAAGYTCQGGNICC
ncbi:unnamed protein product [Caenorhabditis bovis]|uniref:EGF-like domain-containing protein n=1 Tax=Caenorhabditis bovis TaxID=2654633 RepID=A0A8S1F2I4_9PELO|nr:unnamed protein product [Caenorhabditis bovis]